MLLLGFYYIRWHYTFGIADLVGIVSNFLWFFYEFFSIPLLLKTFFVPFHRLTDEPPKGFDIGLWAQRILVSLIMRLVGVFLRTIIIALGVLLEILTFVLGVAFLLVWIAAPLLLLLLIGFGVTFIVTGTK